MAPRQQRECRAPEHAALWVCLYPADLVAGHPEIVEPHQEAYDESAAEDRLIVERIDRRV